MEVVISISQQKHQVFSNKKEYSKPDTPYVRGSELLQLVRNGEAHPVGVMGNIPKYIHQTWKNELLPPLWKQYFDGWSRHHPDFVHVLWTDDDNLALVRECYPEFLKQYNWLPLMIQKTDFVRLMYLHQFGGIYADLDYECYDHFEKHLPASSGVLLVESPLSLVEVTQNSLMIAEPEQEYIYTVLSLICEICDDLMVENSEKYPFNALFKNVFFGKLVSTLSTLFLTGPSTLDKAHMRMAMKHGRRPNVEILPSDQFYDGDVAKHHCNASWFNGTKLLLLFIVVLTTTVLLVLLFCILSTHFGTKKVITKKYLY